MSPKRRSSLDKSGLRPFSPLYGGIRARPNRLLQEPMKTAPAIT